MKIRQLRTTITLSLACIFATTIQPYTLYGQQISIDAETGGLWYSRNDVRIPNDGGTTFDMINLIGNDIEPYLRLRLNVTFGERHTIRALYAPIRSSDSGFFAEDIIFENSTYEAVTAIDGTYQFNTYRLTYRYTFYDRFGWTLGAGAAALIRDAKVQLVQNNISEENTDVGFVPLLHFYAERRIYSDLSAIFDVESLAASQGRATDASLQLNYRINNNLNLLIGYRLLEGGADVDEVYNFSWINFGSATLRLHL
ncbi:MAG: hypothetical protein JJU37_05215 [Balneolaceae bacterium]|nr:hypothetical protein [Balneolaceae bacterium]